MGEGVGGRREGESEDGEGGGSVGLEGGREDLLCGCVCVFCVCVCVCVYTCVCVCVCVYVCVCVCV